MHSFHFNSLVILDFGGRKSIEKRKLLHVQVPAIVISGGYDSAKLGDHLGEKRSFADYAIQVSGGLPEVVC